MMRCVYMCQHLRHSKIQIYLKRYKLACMHIFKLCHSWHRKYDIRNVLVFIWVYSHTKYIYIYEPHHEKTAFLHMQKQRCRSAAQLISTVMAKLISALVFATWIVQYLYFLKLKFQVYRHLLWLYSLVCVRIHIVGFPTLRLICFLLHW